MNYFTKEWYKLCQKTSAHLLLEEDKEAETYSEEYFQKLYNQKLIEWVSQEEFASYQAESKLEPFDKEKVSKQFHDALLFNQENIREILPEEILNIIADIRVFVLDKASDQVIKEVTQFCEDNQKLVDRTINEYENYLKKALKFIDRDTIENISFHDCKVIKIKQTEKSFTIAFDKLGGFTDINEVQFMNYKITKQESSLENSWWLYEELYKTHNKYELHVLLENGDQELIEFIISAEHISFI